MKNEYYLAIIEKPGTLTALIPSKDFQDAYSKYRSSTWKSNQKMILKRVEFDVIEKG